jgi:hypothetical protein
MDLNLNLNLNLNVNIDTIKCVICYDTITDIENHTLNKLCNCNDCLICDNCLIYIKLNNICKCPVCRTHLNITKKSKYVCSIYDFLLYYITIIIFIIVNIITYNIVIWNKYYKSGDYPDITDIDYLIVDNSTDLNLEYSPDNFNICKNAILLKKSNYFMILNFIILIIFPATLIKLYYILKLIGYNDTVSIELLNSIVYLFIIINSIIIFIVIQSATKGTTLLLLLKFNILVYGLLFLIMYSVSIYIMCYNSFIKFKLKYKKMNIIYNIVDIITLDSTIATSDV